MKQLGISPKVIAQAVVAVLGWAAAHYGIQLDPEVSGAIALVAGAIAAWFTGPGTVIEPPSPGEVAAEQN